VAHPKSLGRLLVTRQWLRKWRHKPRLGLSTLFWYQNLGVWETKYLWQYKSQNNNIPLKCLYLSTLFIQILCKLILKWGEQRSKSHENLVQVKIWSLLKSNLRNHRLIRFDISDACKMSEKMLLVVMTSISGHNAWQHYTISIEARHKLLKHDFSVYFKHIAQSCLYLSVNL